MANDENEWPVPDTRSLPPGHRERAVRNQLGLAPALRALRALGSAELQGIEPADSAQWIAAGTVGRSRSPA